MKKLVVLVLVNLIVLSLTGEIKNPDKPLKGTWDFKLEKVWEIKSAGKEEILAFPFGQLVCEDENLVIFDIKSGKNYLYNKDGKFIKSFGPRGEGPGEIREQEHIFLVDKQIVVPDRNKIHYFKSNGNYLKSEIVKGKRRRAALFLSPSEFISATLIPHNAPGGIGKISKINFIKDTNKTLTEFSVFQGGVSKSDGVEIHLLVNALTPIMTLAKYEEPETGK